MTTIQWILLDAVVALLCAAAWFAAGVTAALRRYRLALGLLVTAVAVSLARVGTVVGLSTRGWWFVQEKVLLALPLLGVAGLVAMLLAGPRLLAAARTRGERVPASAIVALFTAGFAALAGLVVSFVAGYPLGWSTSLLAVSLICAATLLTEQAVAPESPDSAETPAPQARPGLSRRQFVGMGAAVAAGTGITGIGLLFDSPESVDAGGGPGRATGSRAPVSVADLRGPNEPAPGGVIRQHTLTAGTGTVRLASGRTVDAWTYNGQVPGPAIVVTQGDLVEVTLRNTDVKGGVTLHWHGYDVPCGEDGAPGATQHPVAPGGEFVYRFRADQVGTYWYHTHQASHLGVRKGLYGTLVVRARDAQPEEVDLTLPVHTFDATVVLGDRDGRAVHAARPGAPVRLRLVNADPEPHWFALAGAAYRVVAVDGRDLHEPGELSAVGLRIPAGGRYDVVLTMPEAPVALVLDHDHSRGVLLRPNGDTGSDPALPDTARWPELDLLRYGRPAPVPFDAGAAGRRFTMVLDRCVAMVNGRPAYAQSVNGLGHPSIPDQLVAEGDLVRFTVVNRSRVTHPWHLHGHSVLLLSRDGIRSTGSPLWVDTFDVRPGQVWEVAFQARNPGIWMNHCHNLPHQDQGMMLRLVYDGVSTPFDQAGHD
jgi:FtsP/CotA-like multicopper oxidase with cupredoxin domain